MPGPVTRMPRPPELASIGDAPARQLAAEILSRPEYAQYREQHYDWLSKFLAWLKHVFDVLPSLQRTAPLLYWSMLLGLAAIAALLLVHMIRTVRLALRSPTPPPSAARQADRDFPAEARALAADGAYLEASHRLLLGSLAQAARAGVIELKPDDGNRAVCDKLRRSRLPAELSARLVALIQETDAIWFGARAQRPELYEAWRATYAQLRAAA